MKSSYFNLSTARLQHVLFLRNTWREVKKFQLLGTLRTFDWIKLNKKALLEIDQGRFPFFKKEAIFSFVFSP